MFADRVVAVLGEQVQERAPEVYQYVQFVLRAAEQGATQGALRAVLREYVSLVRDLAAPSDEKRVLLAQLVRAEAPRVRVCLELVGGKAREMQSARKEALEEYRELLKTELYTLLGE